MILVRALRSARRVQRFLSTLSKEVHHRVGDARDGLVVSGASDGRVKIAHPGRARCGPRQSPPPAPREYAPSPGFRPGWPGWPRGRRWPARAAGGPRTAPPMASRCDAMTRASGSTSRSTDASRMKVPSPGRISTRPRLSSDAQCLANRGAAHQELFGQLALRGQPVTADKAPLGDHRFDLADDFLVDARRLDGRQMHGRSPSRGDSPPARRSVVITGTAPRGRMSRSTAGGLRSPAARARQPAARAALPPRREHG